MRNVYLHGSLGEQYGRHFRLDVKTAGEAIRALSANFPSFYQTIRDGAWHVVRGRDVDTGMDLDADQVRDFNLGNGDLHIVPYVAGSKRGGLLKIILGVVLVGAAFLFTGGALATPIAGGALGGITGTHVALFGAAVAVAGVSQLLAPEESGKDEDEHSFTMSGPSSTDQQGVAMPLVYGEVITGGRLISGGVDIERISASGKKSGSIGGKK